MKEMVGQVTKIEFKNQSWFLSIWKLKESEGESGEDELAKNNATNIEVFEIEKRKGLNNGDYVRLLFDDKKVIWIEKIVNPNDQSHLIWTNEAIQNFSEVIDEIDRPVLDEFSGFDKRGTSLNGTKINVKRVHPSNLDFVLEDSDNIALDKTEKVQTEDDSDESAEFFGEYA